MIQFDQSDKRIDFDSAFEEVYEIVLSIFDELDRSRSLSDSDWVLLTFLRSDVELLYKIHNYGKTEKIADV